MLILGVSWNSRLPRRYRKTWERCKFSRKEFLAFIFLTVCKDTDFLKQFLFPDSLRYFERTFCSLIDHFSLITFDSCYLLTASRTTIFSKAMCSLDGLSCMKRYKSLLCLDGRILAELLLPFAFHLGISELLENLSNFLEDLNFVRYYELAVLYCKILVVYGKMKLM